MNEQLPALHRPAMTPAQLAAGLRWARGYDRRHPPARTEREAWAQFDAAEQAAEDDRWRGR